MIATNVEELICLLESFDSEQPLSIGRRHGKSCILVHGPGSTDCINIPNLLQ